MGRLGATLRLCDSFVTTNEYLAERALGISPATPHGDHAKLSQSRTAGASRKVAIALSRIPAGREMSASTSAISAGRRVHARDFAIVAPALCRLLARDPRIVLRVTGIFGSGRGTACAIATRLSFIPLQDFINVQRLIAEVEINIAPLQDNSLHQLQVRVEILRGRHLRHVDVRRRRPSLFATAL